MKTAVDYLVNAWVEQGTLYAEDIAQAKAMEKEQIINAHFKGQREDIDFINEAKDEAEQYYNETFKNK